MNRRFIATPARRLMAATKGGGLRAKLLRGGVGSLSLKLGNKGLTLLVAIALARTLGPDGYGTYAFVLALISLAMVPVSMGLPVLLVRETAKAAAYQDHALIGALWYWSTRLVLVASGVILLVGVLVLWVSHGWMGESRLLTFAAGLPVILFMGLSQLRAAALRGLHRVVLGQLPEMLVRPILILLGVGVVLVLAPVGWLTPARAMGGYTLAVVGSFVVGAAVLRSCRPAGIRRGKPSLATTKAWLSAIIPLAFLSGIQSINKNTDLVMLGLLGGDIQVGVYRVAMQGGLLVIFGTQALNQVFMPYFSSVSAQGDTTRLQRLVATGTYSTTGTALLVAVVFWVFGRTILASVFGPEYVVAYIPLCILAAGKVFSAAMGQVGALLSMTGYQRQTLMWSLAALSMNIVLNIILIPLFGAVGAAAATTLATVFLNIILWYIVRIRLGVNSCLLGRIISK